MTLNSLLARTFPAWVGSTHLESALAAGAFMLIDNSILRQTDHISSCWPAQENLPKVHIPLRILLDKANFEKTKPDVGISAERMTPKGRHRVTANVCFHCLATRSSYRAKVRQFMRLALSDMCIENPEALSLLMAAPKGHG